MRILRPLALHDDNWTQILQSFSVVGGALAAQALSEVTVVREILSSVVKNRGNAQAAMTLPELTAPESVSELRLLQVLRLMTVLRSQKQAAAASALAATAANAGAVTDLQGNPLENLSEESVLSGDVEILSSHVKQINFGNLWEILCECLDLVRDLEGIEGEDIPEEEGSSGSNGAGSSSSSSSRGGSSSSRDIGRGGRGRGRGGWSMASSALASAHSRGMNGTGNRDEGGGLDDGVNEEGAISDVQEQPLSALTMRFMPLIECFLTVCGSTSLRVPALTVDSKDKDSKDSIGKDGDRRKSIDVLSPDTFLGKRKVAESEEPKLDGVEVEEEESESVKSAAAIATAVRDLSGTVPGARFRNNTGNIYIV